MNNVKKYCYGLAFYKGTKVQNKKAKYLDQLICAITNSNYSHVELILYKCDDSDKYLCLSSSYRDGGVRLKEIDLMLDSWEVFKFDKTKYEVPVDTVMDLYEIIKDFDYDLFGLLCTLSLSVNIKNDKNKYFCSELIAEILGLERCETHTPGLIYNIIIKGV